MVYAPPPQPPSPVPEGSEEGLSPRASDSGKQNTGLFEAVSVMFKLYTILFLVSHASISMYRCGCLLSCLNIVVSPYKK